MVLRVTNLKKSFRSPEGQPLTVVDVPEFEMAAGDQIALSGRSGMGKTTFLNLIAGILKPDAGTIQINGTDIAPLSESRRDLIRARQIGYVFQTFNLLQGYSAIENVMLGMAFGGQADKEHARNLLKRVGMADRLDYKPRQLSVGQQQRVAVARALAGRPKLVLADEPTGNLDPALADEAMALIQEICRENEAALLVVSHDRAIAERFEDVRPLDSINRLVTEGTPS